MNRINEAFLTFFYSGRFPKAPGTCGSLAALIFWFFIAKAFNDNGFSIIFQNLFWLGFSIIAFLYSLYSIPLYAKKVGEIDHKSIVIDEVIGIAIPLQFLFSFIGDIYFTNMTIISIHLIFCFTLFRFFDIRKPSIIGYLDKNYKNAFGVILDDILCGVIVAFLGLVSLLIYNNFL